MKKVFLEKKKLLTGQDAIFSSIFHFVLSFLSLSLSVFFLFSLPLNLSLSSFSVSVLWSCCCGVVCVSCCVVLCFGVRCGVWCVVRVRPKQPRVHRQQAHMLKHMCAWCRYTRRRVEWTHGREEREGSEGGEEENRHQPRVFHL